MKLSFFLVFIFIIMSCESLLIKSTDADFKDINPELVLNAIHEVKNDTLLISLTETVPFSNTFLLPEIKFINNAEISYSFGEEQYDLLPYESEYHNYYLKLPISIQNFNQSIVSTVITHPDYKNIEADASPPHKIIPTSISFIENPNSNGKITDLDYGMEISFKDNPEEDNFYSIGIIGPEYQFLRILEYKDKPGFDTTIIIRRPSIDIETDFASVIKHPSFDKLTFNDKAFSGQHVILKLFFSSSKEFDKETYFISFKTISESLYNLEASIPDYIDSQEFDFSGERASLHSNVSNGIGIFGFINESLYPLQ